MRFILRLLGLEKAIPLVLVGFLLVFCCLCPLSSLASRVVMVFMPARTSPQPTPTAGPAADESDRPVYASAAVRPEDDVRATILVHVASNADLWLEGSKGKQTGPFRRFRTPPLEAGRWYGYELRARWLDGDKVVEQTRRVEIRAGGQTEVDFTRPAPTEQR
jgi:uncharacterized protein (TIGR03000 family)